MAPRPSTSAELLRSSLREPRSRELAITRFLTWAFVACATVALLLIPFIGWKLSMLLALVLGWGGVIYKLQSTAMARGWFHPALQWVNVTVEISVPAALFVVDFFERGPTYALTTPPLAFWGALIMLSGLRAKRTLAIYAGALAAAEYGVLYALLAHPALPADAPVSLQPALILVRCLLLFASGLLTAVVTSQFIQHAEAAFSAVREKELSGKYLLHERIGSGGMAEVFRATYSPEGGFEKLVAVKRVLPAYSEDASFVQMFRREAEVGSRLSHPNVVQVLDLGRDRGTYFLAMEFVDGFSLSALNRMMGYERIPIPAIIFIGAEIASALDYLHTRTGADGQPLKLVHRDVNPPNVLISLSGEVKLSDFGIARAADGVGLTEVGIVRGKAGYMPPEQINGDTLDGRADLFGLGVTLYEAIIGKRLYEGIDTREMLEATLSKPVAPPSISRSDVPKELDAIIMQLLEHEPDKRIRTGAELRHRLLDVPGGLGAVEAKWLLTQTMQRAKKLDAGLLERADPTAATVASKSQPAQPPREKLGGMA